VQHRFDLGLASGFPRPALIDILERRCYLAFVRAGEIHVAIPFRGISIMFMGVTISSNNENEEK
jgi:hypothetical protein